MQADYKNKKLERRITVVNILNGLIAVAVVVAMFGYMKPALPLWILTLGQVLTIAVFLTTKTIRLLNAVSKKEYLTLTWYDIPMLILFLTGLLGAGIWFAHDQPDLGRRVIMAAYICLQIVIKGGRTMVNWAATGGNPTKGLIGSFVILILTGAFLLTLPRATVAGQISFIDALFTATSATCVTGLIVLETGEDFTRMGQTVILALIQLGGLGIIMFGGVIALLLGQAFSVHPRA